MAPPRWLADEMLGRLARYLRFVGCDTAYLQGLADDELLERARREGRVLLTRDRELASRSRDALLIESPRVADQWRAVRRAWPEVPTVPSFDRCSVCNGPLSRAEPPRGGEARGLPPSVRDGSAALFSCESCGHLYWEGSHTRTIRERIAAWEAEGP
jgi:uncharacterized protein